MAWRVVDGGRLSLGICAAILLAGAVSLAEPVLAPVAFALLRRRPGLAGAARRCRARRAGDPGAAGDRRRHAGGAGGAGAGRRLGLRPRRPLGDRQCRAAPGCCTCRSSNGWRRGASQRRAAEQFDSRWMVRHRPGRARAAAGVVGFLGVTLVFVILGLLEVGVAARQLGAHRAGQAGRGRAAAGAASRRRRSCAPTCGCGR